MPSRAPTIVVCGATGQQGGAVVNSLLDSGRWNVVALSRDPGGPRAAALKARGVEVRGADLADGDSLARALEGADGVYGVTTPLTPKGGIDLDMEIAQGVNIADACLANDIGHLVMSTVLYIVEGQERAIPYIRSKHTIERYVEAQRIPHTFLRPASFMDDLGGEYLPVKNGVLTGQADGDAVIAYVACRDIGEFARMAFADPGRFLGQRLNLVGDLISGDELAQALSRVDGGRPYRHKAPSVWLMRVFARQWIPLRRQFEAWGRPPHPEGLLQAVADTRGLRPDTLTFEQYLRATGFGQSAPARTR